MGRRFEGACYVTVQERLLALRLLERQDRDPDQLRRLGVRVRMERRPAAGPRNQNEGEKRYDVI